MDIDQAVKITEKEIRKHEIEGVSSVLFSDYHRQIAEVLRTVLDAYQQPLFRAHNFRQVPARRKGLKA